MPLYSWQDTLYHQQGIHKNGFQLKLGPSILFPKTFQVAETMSSGWEVESCEKQSVKLQAGVGFVGRPHIAINNIDAKRLPVPIHVTTFKSKQPVTVQYLSSTKKKEHNDTPKKGMKICEWYRKRRALKALKKLHEADLKRQRKLREDKARQEWEEEVYDALLQREIQLLRAERKAQVQKTIAESYYDTPKIEEPENTRTGNTTQDHSETVKTKPVNIRPAKTRKVHSRIVKEKPVHSVIVKEKPIKTRSVKEKPIKMKKKKTKVYNRKAIEVKPDYESRKVTTGKFKVHQCRQPFAERCTNCFYRTCCKLYCCLTIMIIMVALFIFAF